MSQEFISFLITEKTQPSLAFLIQAISEACLNIYKKLKISSFNLSKETNQSNIYGERTKYLDQLSNEIILNYLINTHLCSMILSEEMDHPIYLPKPNSNFSFIVAYDPLDGSSNIENYQTLGSIFSIYQVKSDEKNIQIKNHKASLYALYSHNLVLAYSDSDSYHLSYLNPFSNQFILSKNPLIPKKNPKIYSINEAYSNIFPSKINSFIEDLKKDLFSLRYSGTFISDVHQILLKGGIFIYPPTKKQKKGKLRLLYEIIPIASIFQLEQINGDHILLELDEENQLKMQSIFEIKINDIHERYGIAIGSKSLIEKLKIKIEKNLY